MKCCISSILLSSLSSYLRFKSDVSVSEVIKDKSLSILFIFILVSMQFNNIPFIWSLKFLIYYPDSLIWKFNFRFKFPHFFACLGFTLVLCNFSSSNIKFSGVFNISLLLLLSGSLISKFNFLFTFLHFFICLGGVSFSSSNYHSYVYLIYLSFC